MSQTQNNTDNQAVTQEDLDKLFNGKRTKLFRVLLSARMGLLVRINLLLVAFAVPAIVIGMIFSMLHGIILGSQPFSANIGIGFPIVLDAGTAASRVLFMQHFYAFIGIAASIPVFLLGLCGALYTMKFIVRGQVVPVIKTFFIGIKKCFLPFVIVSPIVAGLFFLIASGTVGFDFYMQGQTAVKVLLLILVCLVALVVLFGLFFYTTMAVTYKLNPWQILVNTFRIVFMPKLIWRHFVIAAISAIPVVLSFIVMQSQFGFLFVAIPAMLIGFSFIVLLWSVYADWVYKNVYVPRVDSGASNVSTSDAEENTLDVTFSQDAVDKDDEKDDDRPDSTEIPQSELEIVEDEEDVEHAEATNNKQDHSTTEKHQPIPKPKHNPGGKNKDGGSSYKFKK